jgi:chemotaxis protein MotB
MIDSGKLQVTLKHGRMVVKLPAGVLFASGSAELSKEGQTALSEVASILKQLHDRRFMVAGHTDNVPVGPPSPFKNNLELSTARALTVVAQLVSAGMNPARLVAAGYADHEPEHPNATEAGRQENRRIEIVLLPNLAELPPVPELDAGAPDSQAKR